jgi:hypothetical protein
MRKIYRRFIMKELYTKPEVIVDEYEAADVLTSSMEQLDGEDD